MFMGIAHRRQLTARRLIHYRRSACTRSLTMAQSVVGKLFLRGSAGSSGRSARRLAPAAAGPGFLIALEESRHLLLEYEKTLLQIHHVPRVRHDHVPLV